MIFVEKSNKHSYAQTRENYLVLFGEIIRFPIANIIPHQCSTRSSLVLGYNQLEKDNFKRNIISKVGYW